MISRFDRILTFDGQTDRRRTTAYTALAQRRAVIKFVTVMDCDTAIELFSCSVAWHNN